MNAWRKELSDLLSETGARRRPVLRRSLAPGALYATDLPAAAAETEKQRFCRKAAEAGWTVREADGWLLLDRPVSEPPAGWFTGAFGPEARCCASLIRRGKMRGDTADGDGQRAARQLIKAAEEGDGALEKVCRSLHAEWAERLRKGVALPAISGRFFGEETEHSGQEKGAEEKC